MATMKTLNGYGFNATEFNGKTSDNYLKKTDTATNSAKLGGKAPEYYIQPRNLLDNSDFMNPVNQRGQTSYNSVGYTIDRWTKESNAILTIADDCINIDNSANSTEEVVFQKVDSDTAVKLIGKTVTIAICTSDGTVYAKSGVVVYDVPVALIEHNGFTFQLQFFRNAMSYQVARLIIWKGANISVKWVALYEGSYTAETLPPYVPKGYAAELAECQRRLIPVRSRFTCVAFSSRKMLCNIFSNIPLVGDRRPGLITTRINADIVGNGIHGISLTLGESHGNVHSIEMETDNEVLTQNAAYTVVIPSGVFIEEEL